MPGDSDALRILVEQRRWALMEADVPALASLLDDSYRYVDSLGRDLRRDDYLRSRAEGEVQIESQDFVSLEITLLKPDYAMVLCSTAERVRFRGETFDARYRVVHVCIRKESTWRFLFGQSTTIETA